MILRSTLRKLRDPSRSALKRSGLVVLSVVLLPAASVSGSPCADGPAGVVVEGVAEGSAAGKAGLQTGDLLLSWSRAEAPPANPDPARGAIDSPFDLIVAQTEQAPRGPVTLLGRRGDREAAWTLPPGSFGLTARPPFEGRSLALYQEGSDLIKAKRVADGVERWQRAASEIGTQARAAVWLSARLASALAEARLWPQADAAYGQVVQEAERTPGPTIAAHLLRQWGDTFDSRSDWSRAEELYRRAMALDQALGARSLAIGQSLHRLAITAFHRGDLEAAEGFHRRALALREMLAPGSVDAVASLGNLGTVVHERGSLAEAEVMYQRALAIQERLAPGSRNLASLLNNLATAARERGDLAAAEEHQRKSLSILEKLAPESLDFAGSLNNLGVLTRARGDLVGAEEMYRRALAIREKLAPESIYVARSENNLGGLARARGDLPAAEAHLRHALRIYEKLAPESTFIAVCLSNLGFVAKARGNLAEAETLYRRALGIQEKLAAQSLDVATSLANLGEVARDRGDLQTAETHYKDALAIRSRLAPGSIDEAEVLHDLALVQRGRSGAAPAADALLRALDAFESQKARLGGTEEVRSSFTAKYAAYYHDAMEALLDSGRATEGLHVLERSRARSLLALLAERDMLFAADLPAEVARERKLADAEYDRVQAAAARLSLSKDAGEIDKLLSRLRELRQRQEEIAARIRKASPRLASLQYPEPLELAAVRRTLDRGTVFLAYAVGEKRTVLFVVEAAEASLPGLSVLSLPVTERTLREKVEAFRNAIQRRDPAGHQALAGQAAELYDLLVRPAESRISAAQRLLVSPDGPLHSLPFAALVRSDPSKGRTAGTYLVEWKPLHTVASATVYAQLKKSRREAGSPPGRLVAFGDPRYPPMSKEQADRIPNRDVRSVVTRGFDFTPLPASREEVEGIATFFPRRAQTYLGREATEERAKALGRDARYVHFACHGYLDERFPLDSALALTIPESPPDGQDNGLLQAWEIFEAVRLDADLVTLSACETGLGKEMGGEGLLGLTRAFHYAGARSVLASLWAVSDESTALLMKRFYGYLRQGKARDEALRAAQIDLIRGLSLRAKANRADLAHPFHWAAFRLSGDWR